MPRTESRSDGTMVDVECIPRPVLTNRPQERQAVVDLRTMPIDPTTLQARIDQLGAIGTHPHGGLFRTLYDDGWIEAMALLRSWLEEAGLAVRFDAVGNLWGRVEGTEGGNAVTGSHVDTVRQG